MATKYQAPRGTEDVLPSQGHLWLALESAFREVARRYGFAEMRTPTFEDLELFTRTAGETSDIVTKQMYDFLDKGDRRIALKPEGTAGLMRSVVEHSLCPPGTVLRISTITPIFRYERPQKGRLREAHQFDLEIVGSRSPLADAEIIEATVDFYRSIGLPEVQVLLNSIGRGECRAKFRETILSHAEPYLRDQSEELRTKVQKNPLRLLDSKDAAAQAALEGLPPVTNFLEDESKANFDLLQQLLTDAGVDYVLSPLIVRGLDYYTDTVFEVQSSNLGAQSSLCGGGRYDGLIQELGGSATPSVGVGMGVERALIVLDQLKRLPDPVNPVAFLVTATESARSAILSLGRELRSARVSTTVDPDQRSLKSQLRQADKAGAQFALLIGEDELAKNCVQVRNLKEGTQSEVLQSDVVELLKRSI